MITYIKQNKFLFLISIFLFTNIFLILLFITCRLLNEHHFNLLIKENEFKASNKTYSFLEYVYNSGKAISIQNIINRLSGTSNKHSAFVGYINEFFDSNYKKTNSEATQQSNTSTSTSLINHFYYFNVYLQLALFLFVSFCILTFSVVAISFHLVSKYTYERKKFNFYKLWVVWFFNLPGFVWNWIWENNLKEINDPILNKEIKFKGLSTLINSYYQLFNKKYTENLIEVKNLSFSPSIKHNIFKHYLDFWKFLKFKEDIHREEHLYEHKSLFSKTEDKYILKNINLKIKPNSFNVIIGSNGAGKTTLIKSLINLNEHFLGSVKWNGIEVSKINKKDFARNVSYIPQFMNINYEINVFDFLMLTRMPYKQMYTDYQEQDERIVIQAIRDSGCFEFAEKKMSELSGGQQQKVLLASILTQQSDTIILDEPTVFLDMKNQNILLNSLKTFHNMGKTIIMILHDLQQAIDYASNLIVMKNGSIYSSGKPKHILNEELLRDVFGVQCKLQLNNERLEITEILSI